MRILIIGVMFWSFSIWAADKSEKPENCTAANKHAVCKKDLVKERVQWACNTLAKGDKKSLKKVKKMRYNCCGEKNYVWIQTADVDDPHMIMHPIKPMLNKKSLKDNADKNGKHLFVEFSKAVAKTKSGGWVDYMWTKFGDEDPTKKESWVQGCKMGDKDIIVGSGTWL